MPVVAVLIAARNEAATIGATLAALAAQDYAGPMHVIVVVNGDTQGTAAVVAARQPEWVGQRRLELVEINTGGKPLAWNTADRRVGDGAPRIYLDADVQLSANTVSRLVQSVAGDAPRVAGPGKRAAVGMPMLARICAWAWMRLPWVQGDIVGSGVFAVNPTGRARWGEFPDLIADDGFAVWQFAPSERTVVQACAAHIRFPSRIGDLLRAQRRWIDGGRQLAAVAQKPPFGPAWSGRQRLRAMFGSPRILAAAVITRLLRWAALACASRRATAWSTPR